MRGVFGHKGQTAIIEPENMMRQPAEWFRERSPLREAIFLYDLQGHVPDAFVPAARSEWGPASVVTVPFVLNFI